MAQTTYAINKFVMIYEILQYDSKEMSHDNLISYNQMQIYLVFTTSRISTSKYLYAITICAQYMLIFSKFKVL